MFSQTAEYSLRAVVWLASNAGEPLTVHEIAAVTQVPPDYLSKVMRALARGGLVQAQRGKHGGFTLTRRAEEITALEVVNAVDPIRRIHQCPLGLPAHENELCRMHRRMDEAIRMMERALAETPISELTPETGSDLTGGQFCQTRFCRIGEAAHA